MLDGVTITGISSTAIHGVSNIGDSPASIVVDGSVVADCGRFMSVGLLNRGRLRIRDSRFENNTLTGEELFNARLYRAKIRDSQFVGNTSVGRLGRVRLTDTDILDSEVRGLGASSKMRVRGGTMSGNGMAAGIEGFDFALGGDFLKVRDVEMVGNLTALSGDVVRVRDSTLTGSIVDGVRGRGVFVTRSSVVDSGRYGIRARGEELSVSSHRKGKAVVKHSAVTANGLFGVIVDGQPRLNPKEPQNCMAAAKATLSNSDVTGHGTDAGCGTTSACADLAACEPSLITAAVTCELSYLVESGVPGSSLGVCALDRVVPARLNEDVDLVTVLINGSLTWKTLPTKRLRNAEAYASKRCFQLKLRRPFVATTFSARPNVQVQDAVVDGEFRSLS